MAKEASIPYGAAAGRWWPLSKLDDGNKKWHWQDGTQVRARNEMRYARVSSPVDQHVFSQWRP